MARLCIIAFHVPLNVLDTIFQWMVPEDLGQVHWIVASGDVGGMQRFEALWTTRASMAMCIVPHANEGLDEALFEVYCAEWPNGALSVVVLRCEGPLPRGPLSRLNTLTLDASGPLGELSRMAASDIAARVRAMPA